VAVDLLGALAVFCAVTLFTPGPNNVMLMTSGLNYGFSRTIPHQLGVALGFAFMVALVGVGLGAVFTAYPLLYTVLKYVGAAYLLYLAWAIAVSGPIENDESTSGRPMTFLEAALFQWINPKAWVMAVGAISAYAQVAAFPWNVVIITALFGILGLPSCGVWVLFGSGLRRILTRPWAIRAFNIVMALALVGSLWPVLADLGK
jgi:threonine/homoserine/homoserine lactone efflux protein